MLLCKDEYVTIADTIDGITGPENITEMWRQKYKTLLKFKQKLSSITSKQYNHCDRGQNMAYISGDKGCYKQTQKGQVTWT